MYKVDFKEVMPTKEYQELIEHGCEIYCVGSRTIRGGFTAKSDYDFLVYNPNGETWNLMEELEYTLESGSEHYEPSEGQFNSWRKNNINIIMTGDKLFSLKFLCANNLAQAIGLTTRPERVKLFQKVLYGVEHLD